MRRSFEAIVIGTSAGGIDALSVLLPSLPRDLQAAVLVVIHLAPQRPSLLREILASKSALPVREAEDKETVETGTVYFAPPDYHLLVEGRAGEAPHIALSADEPVNFSRPSIDVLFESAAAVYGERLLGIILTGGSQDGSAGLAAVGAAGGFTVVEDPRSARSPFMASSALASTAVDRVLPLREIGTLLASLAGAP